MSKYKNGMTDKRSIDQWAGPRRMQRHATDALLGRTVTARGKQQPWHRFAETITGQVWCAAPRDINGPGCYWIATERGFYVAHESSFSVLAERSEDVPMLEVAS